MQLKIVFSLLAASLVAFVALPAAADDADMRAAAQLSATPLPDVRDEPPQPLTLLGPAAVIVALSVLGLAITLRGLREDRRKRRVVYRHRGRTYASSPMKSTAPGTNQGMANAVESP